MRPVVGCVVAAAGGAVSATAFTSWGPTVAAPVLVVATVVASRAAAGPLAAAAAGGCAGLTFMGGVLSWMWPSLGFGAWAALTAVQAAFFVILGLGLWQLSTLRGWPVWVAALWTAVEGVRSTQPLGGMPWGRLGFAAPDTPWTSVLPLLGVTGTGFAMALAACGALALVDAGRRRTSRPALDAALAIGVASAPLVVATFTGSALVGMAEPARIGVVQGGVPGSGTRLVDYHREVTDNHVAETSRLSARVAAAGGGLDFVLWPENSTAVDPLRDARARAALAEAVDVAGVPLLAGSITDGPSHDTARNQAIVWTAAGPQDRYTKQHLVPFGEYVPFRWLSSHLSDRVAAIRRDMLPGPEAEPLPIAGLSVAAAICFDVAYDDVLRPQVADGAELVTVSTSNAMFLGTGQLEQQWAITRARAIESGRAVVVTSVNGISGAIGPDGEVLDRLPVRATASTVVEVPLRDGLTPAYRLGAWVGRALTALALLGLVLAALRSPRRRQMVSNGCMVSVC